MDDLDERTAWLVLASVDGIGPETHAGLTAAAGGAAQVLRLAQEGRLPRVLGDRTVPAPVRAAITAAARAPDVALDELDRHDVWTVTPLEASYPARLLVLDPPPPVLYGWGDLQALRAARSVAIVGTRRPTAAGRALAARLAARVVETGAAVVSGLAIGIDGAAHAATLEHGGRTIGVLGAGHGEPGPRAHRPLVRRIVQGGGAVISESAPHVRATRGTFPRRNRVISALADATIVVEAPARSGALITARHALEQGRLLLVAPGRPTDPSVAGCLALLRETDARPVVGLDELVADLGFASPADEPAGAPLLGREEALRLLGDSERAIATRLCRSPAGPDLLTAETGLAPGVVAAALTLLQLRGWAHATGPVYVAAGPLLRDV
jgi:DNA processing protein